MRGLFSGFPGKKSPPWGKFREMPQGSEKSPPWAKLISNFRAISEFHPISDCQFPTWFFLGNFWIFGIFRAGPVLVVSFLNFFPGNFHLGNSIPKLPKKSQVGNFTQFHQFFTQFHQFFLLRFLLKLGFSSKKQFHPQGSCFFRNCPFFLASSLLNSEKWKIWNRPA